MGFLLLDYPQYKALSRANLQETDLKQQLTRTIPQVMAQNAQISQVKHLKSTLALYNKEVPKPEQISQVLDDLTRLSVSNQLSLILLKPESVRQENFYAIIPINIEVTGNYAQIINFINQITLLDYYLYPSKIHLALVNNPTRQNSKITNASLDTLLLQGTTDMYYFSPKPKTETVK